VDLLAVDTNVYIRALRNADRLAQLKRFVLKSVARMRLNSVVALELRAGARTAAQAEPVTDLIAAYSARDRIIVPSSTAYLEAGRVLSALGSDGADLSRAGSLAADALIATSCREASARLVTENVRDFAAVQRHLRGFRYVSADEAFG